MPRKWGAACGAQAVSRKGERRVTRRIWSPGRPAARRRWCCPARVALRSKRPAARWLIALVVDAGDRDRYERRKPDQDRPAFSIACGTFIGIEHRPGFAVCHIAWIGHGCVSQLEHNGGAPSAVGSIGATARAIPDGRLFVHTSAVLTGLKPEVEVPTLRPFRIPQAGGHHGRPGTKDAQLACDRECAQAKGAARSCLRRGGSERDEQGAGSHREARA